MTKTNSPIPDGRLFVVGAATGGDRVSASGKDGRTPAMRRLFAKWAHCKWHNLRHRRGAATPSLVPERRWCPPKWWVPFQGGTIGVPAESIFGGAHEGETRRKGAQHSLVRERNKSGVPAERTQSFRWGIIGGPRQEIFDFLMGLNGAKKDGTMCRLCVVSYFAARRFPRHCPKPAVQFRQVSGRTFCGVSA